MARKRTTLGQDRTAADPWTKIRAEAEVLLGKVQAFGAPVTWEDHFRHAVLTGAHFTEIHARPLPTGEWWTIYTPPEATALHLPVGARPKGPPRIEVVEGPDRWAAAEELRVRLRQHIRERGPAIHVRLPDAPVEHVLHLLGRDLADVLHGADDLGHGRELVDVANLLRTIVGEVEDYTLTAAEVAARWGTSRIQDVYEARDLLWRHDPTTGQKRYSVSSARKVGEARLNRKAARETTVDRYQARKPVIGRNEKTTA